jgi:hypothetical protein
MSSVIVLVGPPFSLLELTEHGRRNGDRLEDLLTWHPGLRLDPPRLGRVGHLALVGGELTAKKRDDDRPAPSVGHLYLDTDGVLTAFAARIPGDDRTQSEVTGAMADIAAAVRAGAAASLPTVEQLRAGFEKRARGDPRSALQRALGDVPDYEAFWKLVARRMQERAIRLIYVAGIPPDMRRTADFLDAKLKPVRVLGIEVASIWVGRGELRQLGAEAATAPPIDAGEGWGAHTSTGPWETVRLTAP